MQPGFLQAFDDLYEWCRARDFAGYDPFDALNSRLFQASPLKRSPFLRLVWTQLLKRSPVNLRKFALVPAEQNAKGLALFALATLANHRRIKTVESERVARQLLEQLISMQLTGRSGAAWGYNFDWQSRLFFAPRGTPTIVPTAFAARALLEAYRVFNDNTYLDTARSACNFIVMDLTRSVDSEMELCFSYTPLSTTRIYNASLLAAETLGATGSTTGEVELCQMAVRAARYVVNRQRSDGSWTYGEEPGEAWVDNFHTAFLLSSLARIVKDCRDDNTDVFQQALRRGYEFWRKRFFLADGWPKYYDYSPYPADAHAAATAITTLTDLGEFDEHALTLAEKIAQWSIRNLRDSNGSFYYQRRRFYTVRIPFMRWSEAWMLYGIARLLEQKTLYSFERKGAEV